MTLRSRMLTAGCALLAALGLAGLVLFAPVDTDAEVGAALAFVVVGTLVIRLLIVRRVSRRLVADLERSRNALTQDIVEAKARRGEKCVRARRSSGPS